MWAHNIPATSVKEERGKALALMGNKLDPAGCRHKKPARSGVSLFPEPFLSAQERKGTGSDGSNSLSARIHSTNTANKKEKVPSFLFVITLFCHCCQEVPMQYVPLWCLVPVCFIFSWVGCTVISHSFSLSILCVLFRFLHLQDFGKPLAFLATLSLLPHLNLLCQFSSHCLGDDSLYICTHKWIC